ncbi:MAG: hypothetical protein ACREJB_17525, partial [Planctomycetaceae bacterium]
MIRDPSCSPFRGAAILLAACALLRGDAIIAAEPHDVAEETARKQRVATAGVYLLGIVAFVGVMLVVMTVMWG